MTWLLYGDSQIQGLAHALAQLLGGSVISDAHVGMSLSQGATQLPAEVDGADSVLISLGGNNPPTSYSSAVAQMSALLSHLQGKKVYWMTVLPSENPGLQPARAQMAAWQKRYLPTQGVVVIDGAAAAAGLPRAGDPHLTAAGYTALAGRVLSAIQGAGRGRLAMLVLAGAAIGAGLAYVRRGSAYARRR